MWPIKLPGILRYKQYQILAKRPNLVLINIKKRICQEIDFAILADHRLKIKESENINKYLDLARELKKQWNVKMMAILIGFGAFEMVAKDPEKRLQDWRLGAELWPFRPLHC